MKKKPLSVSITSGRRIDCGGWKQQLSKSDWDKSQRLKVFGRLYFAYNLFIYLNGGGVIGIFVIL